MPVLQLAASGALAVLLLAVLAVVLLHHAPVNEAIDDARRVTTLSGNAVIEPVLQDDIVRRDPGAAAALDKAVRAHVLKDGVVRVKVWAADGTILYSDEPRLIGTRHPLGVRRDDRVPGEARVERGALDRLLHRAEVADARIDDGDRLHEELRASPSWRECRPRAEGP